MHVSFIAIMYKCKALNNYLTLTQNEEGHFERLLASTDDKPNARR